MGMEIVTGYAGVSHITSKHDAVINASALPTAGKYVIKNLMDGLSAELISGNTIRIGSGFAFNQGRLMGIDNYDAEDVTIAGGTSGTKRADLIVIRYQKDSSTGIETASLTVIQGTEGATYVDPDYYDNDLLNDDSSVDDLPLYRVKLDGLTIDSIEPIFSRWYLDTGWRTDLVEINFNIFSGPSPTHTPAIRVVGNQVYFRGGVWYNASGQVSDPNYQIPSEFSPNKMVWNSFSDTLGTGTGLYMLKHTLTADGKISLNSRLYADSGAVTNAQLDTSYINWFLD